MRSSAGWKKVSRTQGWTRPDVAAVLLVLFFLGTCLVSLLASPPRATKLAACASNLRIMGQAVATWGSDYNDLVPWRTLILEGGTMPSPGTIKPGAAWFEWTNLSNHLASPEFLVCPEDTEKHLTTRWSAVDPAEGFLNLTQRDRALSYIVGCEVFETTPRAMISGDRNIRYDIFGSSCSARINNVNAISTYLTSSIAGWTNSIHGLFGNLLFLDGSVERVDNDRFIETIAPPGVDDNGPFHILPPR